DSGMTFEVIGRSLIAHYYNQDITRNNGSLNVVYTCKQVSGGKWVEDVERGVKDTANQYPWQTDTSIGDWYYRTGQKYKTAAEVIQMLVDIVSKNGNLHSYLWACNVLINRCGYSMKKESGSRFRRRDEISTMRLGS
ncbi:alpha-L-fucosidase, partial [Candidatus Roizmanbacteria bacterium]|nr:alpha-L-fucosidase [Candidatus Roizmanbacteria bacterium]